jgi:hypothetical protein
VSKQTDSPFPDHRGKATWGERIVPLDEFQSAAATAGRELSDAGRRAEVRRFLSAKDAPTPVEGPFERVLVFGGVYNNHLALEALLEQAANEEVDAVFCLGDLGGFGPSPEKVRPLLDRGTVRCIRGNYEESLSAGEEDCNCGYTDPRDNHFAALSYAYTAERCSRDYKDWMGHLPGYRRIRIGDRELLLVHGSPRRVNEFLFHSTTSVAYLEVLLDQFRCDGFLCTHTGLQWHVSLPSGRDVANVGVIGRPANDGRTEVWYAMLEARDRGVEVQVCPLRYDHETLANEMRSERLPEEFVDTIVSGWWTTCLEILPARERARSRF